MDKIIKFITLVFLCIIVTLYSSCKQNYNTLLFEFPTSVGNFKYQVSILKENKARKQDVYFNIILENNDEVDVPKYSMEHTLPAIGIIKTESRSTIIKYHFDEWMNIEELEKMINESTVIITNEESEKELYTFDNIIIKRIYVSPHTIKK